MIKPYFVLKSSYNFMVLIELCYNQSPQVIKYFEDNLDNIFNNLEKHQITYLLNDLSCNPYTTHIINKYLDNIRLSSLCNNAINKKQIDILKNNINRNDIDWYSLSRNIYMISFIEEILDSSSKYNYLIDKINWRELSSNKNAINIIEKTLNSNDVNKINWKWLSRNENAINIIKNTLDSDGYNKINWEFLNENRNVHYIYDEYINSKYTNNINWWYLCSNKNCIHIIENMLISNYNKINWKALSCNINAIHILEKNQDKIDWGLLSGNPNAISILEKNIDKINWLALSSNPNAINLLEKNLDKIISNNAYRYLSRNQNTKILNIIDKLINNYNINIEEFICLPNRIDATYFYLKLDYKKMHYENGQFLEELVSKVFNPNRLLKLCHIYNLTFDEINDIY